MSAEPRTPVIGEHVVWHDPYGQPNNALVNCVWNNGLVNLIVLSSNEKEQDHFGRQSKHETSVYHRSSPFAVHGRYWRFPDEEPIPVQQPAST